jgi:hypothetical protein
MARDNQVSGAQEFASTPEIQAARWIESNTEPTAIIASGQNSLIHHYSRRRVVWFPPISNPDVVMEGIRRYHVQYIVVITRRWYYYLPPETLCFELLDKAYPGSFRLVHSDGQVRIYQVLPESSPSLGDAASGKHESLESYSVPQQPL